MGTVAAMLGLSAAYAGAWFGATLGLSALAAQLVSVWGVTAANLSRAPAWLQFLYPALHPVIGIFVSAPLIALTAVGIRLLNKEKHAAAPKQLPRALIGLCGGALCALVPVLALAAADSIRFARPFTAPVLDGAAPIVALHALCSALSWVIFFRNLLSRYARPRIGLWPTVVAIAALEIGVALVMGARGWMLINYALIGALLCLMTENGFGLWACVLFRFGFSLVDVFAFGASGNRLAARSVYGAYVVSEEWLSDGVAGLLNGGFVTVLFAGLILALALDRRRRQ